MTLLVEHLSIERGGVRVVDDASVSVPRGRSLAILGPSGSGKSSLLLAIAGLIPATTGTIHVAGVDVAGVPPERRSVGLMFQEFALFPHLSVRDNVAYGPRMHGVDRPSRDAAADEQLERVGLGGFGPRDVATLSGGQRQRVALARALATSPDVLLLDEPLGALDRQLREELLSELRGLLEVDGPAVVAVTHDRDEAFSFGDEVLVLRDGQITQSGTPDELWGRPIDAWTARFLGHDNVLDAATTLRLGLGEGPSLVPVEAVTVGTGIDGVVTSVAWRSGRRRVVVAVGDVDLVLELPGAARVAVGEAIEVAVDRAQVRPL